jgi:ketosteroid isomerase-like protein
MSSAFVSGFRIFGEIMMNNYKLASVSALGFAAISSPAFAQTMDHSGHSMDHGDHQALDKDANTDASGAVASLAAYRNALVSGDADAMTALFAEESYIYENGKDEGSFAHYMEHHLGPELGSIKSFTFTDPTIAVTRMGHMAFARETYDYRIELADGRVIEREGAATSVLSHDAAGWKIVQYHSSSRAPRKP